MVPKSSYKLLGFDDNKIPDTFKEYIKTAHNAVLIFLKSKGGFKVFETLNIYNDKIQEVLKNQVQKSGLKTDISPGTNGRIYRTPSQSPGEELK